MVRGSRVVLAVAAALLALPLLAQVSVTPKAGSADAFSVKVGAAAPATVALQRVAEYPAQKLKKSCQDPLFKGMQVMGAWTLADVVPAPGSVVGVYDEVQLLDRMGYPSYPLASVQGPGYHVTVHWVTPLKLKSLSQCHDKGRYDWWYTDLGGPDSKRAVLLLDIVTDAGREWWLLEKCGDAPTTVRKLEAPGTAADMECPQGGK